MTEAMSPRWQEADEAVQSLVDTLVAAAVRTADRSNRKRPHGRSTSKGRPKNARRQIAEVIRRQRLVPGLRVDRYVVGALLIGHRDLVTNPDLVVAVAQACSIIEGRKLSAKKATRMRAASLHVAELIARADADTPQLPAPRAETAPVAAPVQVDVLLRPPAEAAPTQHAPTQPTPVAADRRRRWWPAVAAFLFLVFALLVLLAFR